MLKSKSIKPVTYVGYTNDLKKISGPLPYNINAGIRETVKWINKYNG